MRNNKNKISPHTPELTHWHLGRGCAWLWRGTDVLSATDFDLAAKWHLSPTRQTTWIVNMKPREKQTTRTCWEVFCSAGLIMSKDRIHVLAFRSERTHLISQNRTLVGFWWASWPLGVNFTQGKWTSVPTYHRIWNSLFHFFLSQLHIHTIPVFDHLYIFPILLSKYTRKHIAEILGHLKAVERHTRIPSNCSFVSPTI